MAFGSFDRSKNASQPMAEINMVPLIDVVLVLLVIFIVTAPLLTNTVKLDLPKASSNADIQKPEKVEFAIDATGSLFWAGERISRVLVLDLDVRERLALHRIDRVDGVGEAHRVADVDRAEEADAVVAERHRRLVARGAAALVDHHRRAGRHEADEQDPVGDPAAVFRLRHVGFVDMVDGEIAGDAGEEIDIALADSLGEADAVAGLDVEVAHSCPLSFLIAL